MGGEGRWYYPPLPHLLRKDKTMEHSINAEALAIAPPKSGKVYNPANRVETSCHEIVKSVPYSADNSGIFTLIYADGTKLNVHWTYKLVWNDGLKYCLILNGSHSVKYFTSIPKLRSWAHEHGYTIKKSYTSENTWYTESFEYVPLRG